MEEKKEKCKKCGQLVIVSFYCTNCGTKCGTQQNHKEKNLAESSLSYSEIKEVVRHIIIGFSGIIHNDDSGLMPEEFFETISSAGGPKDRTLLRHLVGKILNELLHDKDDAILKQFAVWIQSDVHFGLHIQLGGQQTRRSKRYCPRCGRVYDDTFPSDLYCALCGNSRNSEKRA